MSYCVLGDGVVATADIKDHSVKFFSGIYRCHFLSVAYHTEIE